MVFKNIYNAGVVTHLVGLAPDLICAAFLLALAFNVKNKCKKRRSKKRSTKHKEALIRRLDGALLRPTYATVLEWHNNFLTRSTYVLGSVTHFTVPSA
jgi:hypothetical protein